MERAISGDGPTYTAHAPGRLDVMGGIADYSGALVLQLPLDRTTFVTVRRIAERRCEIASLREGEWSVFDVALDALLHGPLSNPAAIAQFIGGVEGERWAAYVVGIIHACLQRVTCDPNKQWPGLRIDIASDVPEGKGVSSSAAVEVATMAAVAASYGVDLTPYEIAVACQWVENHVVGAPCGIMDQITSACGRQDRLLRLRCQPATIEGYLEIPRGYRVYGIDSGIRHAVTGADYETVRCAAFMGYRIITDLAGLPVAHESGRVIVVDPVWGGYLTNILPTEFESRFRDALPERMTGADFLRHFAGTTDTVTHVRPGRSYPVRQATAHPIYEQARVERFVTLLGDVMEHHDAALELGQLMYESHASYSACGLGHAATDRLVALVQEAGPAAGVFGAKITGGGSGGTVAIFGTEFAEPVVRDIARRYSEETGWFAEVFAASGPGLEQVNVSVD